MMANRTGGQFAQGSGTPYPSAYNQSWNSNVYSGNREAESSSHPSSTYDVEKELFSGVNSGINFDKYEDIPVEATGSDVPAPFSSFDQLKIDETIQENIKMMKYAKPTPVQKHAIPTLLKHRDLMSCAQTGSGKTAAFLIPLIDQIIRENKNIREAVTQSSGRRCQFPQAVILSPTRELAMQTHGETLKFSYRTAVKSAILYGGRENYRDQLNRFRLGCHILIATPGRLIDIMSQGMISFKDCMFLVLDEADRMLDMGFEPQVRKIVEQSDMPNKGLRVTAMFSATFPKEIQVLAQDFLVSTYVFLAVGRVGSTSENISQKIVWVEDSDKTKMLMELIDADAEKSLMLIFVETKKRANELAWTLQRKEYGVVPIHGDLAQYERERHLGMFRTGQVNLLVATAVAARGLDIPNVKHVVNYDLPGDIDEYVHRIGRTGRAGNTGLATSFFNDKNFNIGRDLVDLLVEANQDVPGFLQNTTSSYGSRQGKGRSGRFGGRDHRVHGREVHPSYSVPCFSSEKMAGTWAGSTANFNNSSTFNRDEQRGFQSEQKNGFYQSGSGSFGFASFRSSGNSFGSGMNGGWNASSSASFVEMKNSDGTGKRGFFETSYQW